MPSSALSCFQAKAELEVQLQAAEESHAYALQAAKENGAQALQAANKPHAHEVQTWLANFTNSKLAHTVSSGAADLLSLKCFCCVQ